MPALVVVEAGAPVDHGRPRGRDRGELVPGERTSHSRLEKNSSAAALSKQERIAGQLRVRVQTGGRAQVVGPLVGDEAGQAHFIGSSQLRV